jgi:hypothetical protein
VVGCRGGTGGLLWTFEDTSCSVGRRFGCAFLRPEISLIQKIAPLIVHSPMSQSSWISHSSCEFSDNVTPPPTPVSAVDLRPRLATRKTIHM